MADETVRDGFDVPPERVAGGAQCHPLTAVSSKRGCLPAPPPPADRITLARRNEAQSHRPINAVMEAAITACDLSHRR